MPLPVATDVSVGRLPSVVEATAYFVVAEALTNVVKHARRARAEVSVHVEDGTLSIAVRDDGIGGARPDGTGLVGLRDRLEALDGRLVIDSPTGHGTLVAAEIPLSGHPGPHGATTPGLRPRPAPSPDRARGVRGVRRGDGGRRDFVGRLAVGLFDGRPRGNAGRVGGSLGT